MRWPQIRRALATAALGLGILTLAWVVVVWRWQDPFTALYTHFEQSRLASRYARTWQSYTPRLPSGIQDAVTTRRLIRSEARAYERSLRIGDPVGRLKIGRIGLNIIVVEGTDHNSLKKGPGHYTSSALPGEGELIYIAGHRTTYLAPFADINDIRNGDYIRFELPYGTFAYRATRHYVVNSDDIRVLINRGREILRLQACHPRFFATQRYIVDARLAAFKPRGWQKWLTLS